MVAGIPEYHEAWIDRIAVTYTPVPFSGLYYGYPESLALPATGTAHASSFDNFEVDYYAPIRAFSPDNNIWYTYLERVERGEEWIAFQFDTPQEIAHLYLAISGFGPDDYLAYPMEGGDVWVSNDFTNGVDGKWRRLVSGVFDSAITAMTGSPADVLIEVPLCSGEPITVHQEKLCNMDTFTTIDTWDLAAKTFTDSGETYTYDDETKFYEGVWPGSGATTTAEEFFTALSVMGRGVAISYDTVTKYTCSLQAAAF